MPPELLSPPPRSDSRGTFKDAAAVLLDSHLRRLARIRQPIDLRVGRLLVQAEDLSAYLALGCARLGDYTTERLGLPWRRVRTLIALARSLDRLPRLAAAFEAGAISQSQVRLLLRVVTPDSEAAWLARAGATTVRCLEMEVRAAAGAPEDEGSRAPGPTGDPAAGSSPAGGFEPPGIDDDADPAFETIGFTAPPALAARWQQALDLARRVAGAADPAWRSVEFILADFLAGAPALPESLRAVAAAADRQGGADHAMSAECGATAGNHVATGHRSAAIDHRSTATGSDGIELFEEILNTIAADPQYGPRSRMPADDPMPAIDVDDGSDVPHDPRDLDRRLRGLVEIRQNVSWHLGRLLRIFADRRLHAQLGFRSFARYCRERLGLGPRRAWMLVALDRRLLLLPATEAAYRRGTLSWVKASAVARVATDGTEARWLVLAGAVTVRRLLEEVALDQAGGRELHGLAIGDPSTVGPRGLDQEGRVQLSTPVAAAGDAFAHARPANAGVSRLPVAARPVHIRFRAPREVATLWDEALAICRLQADAFAAGSSAAAASAAGTAAAVDHTGRRLDDWECVDLILESFFATWAVRTGRAWQERYRVFERDGWRCRVPGCTSRRNLQAHHVKFRSHGGSDDDANLVTLCATHHLQGIHRGRLRCHRLPDGLLAWEFAPDPARGALLAYVEDVLWSEARRSVRPDAAPPAA